MIQSDSLIDSYLGLGQSVKIWSHWPNDNIISDYIKQAPQYNISIR